MLLYCLSCDGLYPLDDVDTWMNDICLCMSCALKQDKQERTPIPLVFLKVLTPLLAEI